MELNGTSFSTIYDSFNARVTDQMYMEITELDTLQQEQDILLNALHRFEFPRFDIYNYEIGYLDYIGKYKGVFSDDKEVPCISWIGGAFSDVLTPEEINILSLAMLVEWLGQQLTTTENTQQKFTGSDFKLTSQASHMAKLKVLKDAAEKDCLHAQRLYSRRRFLNGETRSTAAKIMTTPSYGLKID